jgi:hypothetical protein
MTSEQTRLEILQKLMALHAWDAQRRPSGQPRLVDLLLQQWESPAGCKPLEDALKKEQLDETPPDDVDERLYERLFASAPLRRQLVEGPLFSEADQITLRILVQLADVTPNREQTMMDSGDALFQRILEHWRQEPVTAEQLLHQDLARLLELNRNAPAVVAALAALAAEARWQPQMQALESRFENPNATRELSPTAEKVRQEIKAFDEPNGRNMTADILLSQPRYSATLPLLVRLFANLNPTTAHEDKIVEELLNKRPDEMDAVMREVQYRLEAADYFLTLRKFAKLDALAYKWPDLYQRFNVQRSAVVEFEQYINEPETTRDEPSTLSRAAQRLWEAYSQDEDLVRFLHLRPLLNDVYKTERERYQQLQGQVAAPQHDRSVIQENLDSANLIDSEKETLLHQMTVENHEESYVFHFTPAPDENTYRMNWALGSGNIVVDWTHLASLETRLLTQVETSDSVNEYLIKLGRALFTTFLDSAARDGLVSILRPALTGPQRRILLRFNAPELNLIPWESLYVPTPIDRQIGASSHFSLLRYLGSVKEEPVYAEHLPLRIMVVVQGPRSGTPAVDVGYERKVTTQFLDDTVRYQLKFLENVTWEELLLEVMDFFPQVIHFVSPSPHEQSETDQGFLLMVDKNQDSQLLFAKEVGEKLKGTVKLMVLVQAGTVTRNMMLDNFMIQSATGLVSAGIPSVVAPIRTGRMSVPFHRTFYQSLADGNSVDGAVLAARRTLKTENQPWIRYAHFAGVQEPVQLIVGTS